MQPNTGCFISALKAGKFNIIFKRYRTKGIIAPTAITYDHINNAGIARNPANPPVAEARQAKPKPTAHMGAGTFVNILFFSADIISYLFFIFLNNYSFTLNNYLKFRLNNYLKIFLFLQNIMNTKFFCIFCIILIILVTLNEFLFF
jgi:hypothetical protein